MGKRFGEEEKMMAMEAYRDGATLQESAMLIGASPQSVKNWLDVDGAGTRGCVGAHDLAVKKGRGRFHGEDVYDCIREMYLDGVSAEKIAGKLDLKYTMVAEAVRRMGIVRTLSEAAFLNSEEISKQSRKYGLNESIFDGNLTPEAAWVLGVIYGDGWVMRSRVGGPMNGIGISGDEDVVRKAVAIMESEHPVRRKGGCFVVEVGSRKLAASAVANGVMPRKSTLLKWPVGLRVSLDPHFLRGVWDADGWVGKNGKTIGIGMGSRKFIESIADRMWEITGFRPAVSCAKAKKETHSDSWSVRLYSKKARRFAEWMWNGSKEHMRGDRKYGLFTLLSPL